MEDQPRTRTPLRIALWIVATLVAVVLIAWGALAVVFPPARVRELVSARLADVLARDVKFADASIGIWPPVRLSVQRPALAEPGGFPNGSALKARSLHLDLDVFALFSRKVVVRRLVIDRPELHLVLRRDGTTNFDGIMKPPPDRKPADADAMSLEIRELRIQNGRALIDEIATTRRKLLAERPAQPRASAHDHRRHSCNLSDRDERMRRLGSKRSSSARKASRPG